MKRTQLTRTRSSALKKPARVRELASGRRMGKSTEPNQNRFQQAASTRHDERMQKEHVVKKLSNTPLSGRAFLYIAPFNVGASVCVGGNIASMAICKPGVRAAANVGDVIITITPSAKAARI